MNTKTMLEREPFYEVLTDSIRRYFKIVHKKTVTVSLTKMAGSKKIYLYLLPLFATGLPITKEMKEFLYSEYNIRNHFLKYLIGKAGVFCITHSFGLAAHKVLYIMPADMVDCGLFISPCNRTIRFYDFENNYVDCLIKSGYKNDYMKNQLRFRMNHSYSFIPSIMTYGDGWYRERIMHGNALARVRDQRVYDRAVQIAMEDMGILAKNTMQYIDSICYYQELRNNIAGLIRQFQPGDKDNTVFAELFSRIDSVILSGRLMIPTVISHGDLQGGNIWVNKEGDTIIYDWETNRRRSVWFDPATFYYELHSGAFSVDIGQMLQKDQRVFVNDPQKDYTPEQLRAVARVILLEDIIFYLTDVLQLPAQFSRTKFHEITERLLICLDREEQR